LTDELKGYEVLTGSMRFAVDKPLPKTLVKKLIRVRLAEIELQKAAKLAKKAASRKQKP
jgi:uncharacterized protein YdhG (YjbR/CyaY superfamily)